MAQRPENQMGNAMESVYRKYSGGTRTFDFLIKTLIKMFV